MSKAFIVIMVIMLPIFIIISCSKGGGGDNNGGGGALNCSTVSNKSYAADVNPIVQSTCNQVSCHAAGSVNGPGALTNQAQMAAASTLVRAAIASGTMPQNTTLTTAQKNSILCWIDSGAPNN